MVNHLLKEDNVKVIGLSRHGGHSAAAKALMTQGVTMLKGDMDDPLSLDRAMAVASGALPGRVPPPTARVRAPRLLLGLTAPSRAKHAAHARVPQRLRPTAICCPCDSRRRR